MRKIHRRLVDPSKKSPLCVFSHKFKYSLRLWFRFAITTGVSFTKYLLCLINCDSDIDLGLVLITPIFAIVDNVFSQVTYRCKSLFQCAFVWLFVYHGGQNGSHHWTAIAWKESMVNVFVSIWCYPWNLLTKQWKFISLDISMSRSCATGWQGCNIALEYWQGFGNSDIDMFVELLVINWIHGWADFHGNTSYEFINNGGQTKTFNSCEKELSRGDIW